MADQTYGVFASAAYSIKGDMEIEADAGAQRLGGRASSDYSINSVANLAGCTMRFTFTTTPGASYSVKIAPPSGTITGRAWLEQFTLPETY